MERNLRINWHLLVEEAIKRRKQQKMSQEKFALYLGLSKPTIVNFEKGNTNIAVGNAMKILQALGLADKL